MKATEEKQKEQRTRDKRSAADAAAVPDKRRKLTPQEQPKAEDRDHRPRWSERDYSEGRYDKTAKPKPFEGDPDQCFRVNQWGRIKKNLYKSQMPKRGLITESVTCADLRKDQPVYCCDKTGDGWSVVRFLPEEIVSQTNKDGTIIKNIEVPSSVFVQAFIPTSYLEPHPWWKFGVEYRGKRSTGDLVREQEGKWSRVSDYAETPWIPAEPVKRWRDPRDTGHTDGVKDHDGNNTYMEYKRDERITYEQNRLVGTIIGPAHPFLVHGMLYPNTAQWRE